MQGTIVMLMALSGLGCHHKSCDVTYVPSYYGTGACSSTGYAHDGWGPSSGGSTAATRAERWAAAAADSLATAAC